MWEMRGYGDDEGKGEIVEEREKYIRGYVCG